jgi:hypothetical protein
MPRIVLAAALLLLSGEAARADDFKTCASGAPDCASIACTNLIEGGKLDTARASHCLYQPWRGLPHQRRSAASACRS